MYGLIMMAKSKTIEFYVESLEERESWVNAMKKFIILLDLKDEFTIGKLLGRGNFAKVHLCTRKSDYSTKYALKTMQKSALAKSKRNIVSISFFCILGEGNEGNFIYLTLLHHFDYCVKFLTFISPSLFAAICPH